MKKWTFEYASTAMKYWIYDEQDKFILSVSSKKTAQRIVACINACDGFKTEYLESVRLVEVIYENEPFNLTER